MTQNLSEPKTKTNDLYETDFYAWTVEQAKLLQDGVWDALDIPNLVEEIESLGKRDQRELKSRLKVLIAHLLKYQYQPHKRVDSDSWLNTIEEQRFQILLLVKGSPSLKPSLHDAANEVYEAALKSAMRETRLSKDSFPQECPYQPEQILDTDFFPE